MVGEWFCKQYVVYTYLYIFIIFIIINLKDIA